VAWHVKEERRHFAVVQPGPATAAAPWEMATSPFRDDRIPTQVKGSLPASEGGGKEAES